jgi:hypothetical protein
MYKFSKYRGIKNTWNIETAWLFIIFAKLQSISGNPWKTHDHASATRKFGLKTWLLPMPFMPLDGTNICIYTCKT